MAVRLEIESCDPYQILPSQSLVLKKALVCSHVCQVQIRGSEGFVMTKQELLHINLKGEVLDRWEFPNSFLEILNTEGQTLLGDKTGLIWVLSKEKFSIPVKEIPPSSPFFKGLTWLNGNILAQFTNQVIQVISLSGQVIQSFEFSTQLPLVSFESFVVGSNIQELCLIETTHCTSMQAELPAAFEARKLGLHYFLLSQHSLRSYSTSLFLECLCLNLNEEILDMSVLTENTADILLLLKDSNYLVASLWKYSGYLATKVQTSVVCDFGVSLTGELFVQNQNEIYEITSAQASVKFRWLMDQGKFEEASAYASECGEAGHELVKSMISTILSEGNPRSNFQSLVSLIKCLTYNKEELLKYLSQVLTTLTPCDPYDYLHQLDFALLNLKNLSAKSNTQHLKNLRDIRSKLRSFLAVFKSLYGQYKPQDWKTFAQSNLVRETKKLFSIGDTELAIFVFNKHASEHPELRAQVTELVRNIPLTEDLDKYSTWLQQRVIPWLKPEELKSLEGLLLHRAQELEAIEGHPLKALHTTCILSHSPLVASRLGHSAPFKNIFRPGERFGLEVGGYLPSSEFLELQKCLEQLVEMKDRYGLSLSLSGRCVDRDTIALAMLERVVAPELLIHEIKNNLIPYTSEYSLDLDQVLLTYIKDLTERMTYSGCETWEQKAVHALEFIQDLEKRINATIEVIQHARQPLSPLISKLLEDSLKLPTTNKDKLLTQRRMEDLHEIAGYYKIEDIHITDKFQTTAVLLQVLHSKDPDSLKHSLKITEVFSWMNEEKAYFYYLMICSARGEVKQGIEHLKKLRNEGKKAKVIEQVLSCCLERMQGNWHNRRAWQSELFHTAVEAAIKLSQELCRFPSLSVFEAESLYKQLQSVRTLAKDFKVYLGVPDYTLKQNRLRVLEEFLTPYLHEINKQTEVDDNSSVFSQSSTSSRKRKKVSLQSPNKRVKMDCLSLSNLYHLSDLLGLSRTEFRLAAAELCGHLGFYHTSAMYLKELSNCTPSKELLGSIKAVVLRLMDSEDPKIFDHLIPIAKWSLTHCEANEISNYMKLAEDLERGSLILMQTEMGEDLHKHKDNIFGEENFVEEQMYLDKNIIMPQVRSYVLSRECLQNQTRQLVEDLNRNGCLTLGIHIVLESPEVLRENELETTNVSLLEKVINSREIDHKLALALAVSVDSSVALKTLQRSLPQRYGDYARMKKICQIGYDAALLKKDEDQAGVWSSYEGTSRWLHTLTLLDVCFEKSALTSGDPEEIVLLFREILEKTQDLYLCLELCRTYNIRESEAVLAYIEYQLLNPIIKSKYLEMLESGDLVLQDSPFDESYKDKVAGVAFEVTDDELGNLLKCRCLPRIVQTDYSRILFIFDYLVKIYPESPIYRNHYNVVQILSNYKRVSQPTYEETSVLNDLLKFAPSELQAIYSAVLKEKLSLDIFLTDPWVLLNQELHIHTLDTLILLASPLKKDPDSFRIKAVENSFSGKVVHPFSEVYVAISKIKTAKSKYNVLEYASKYYPLGEDYLRLKKEQLKVCKIWKDHVERTNPDPNLISKIEGYVQINEKKLNTETLRLKLQKHGLESEFVSLLETPEELISQLYYSLIPRVFYGLCYFTSYELEDLVEYVAERFGIKLEDLKCNLLLQWLKEDSNPPGDPSQVANSSASSLGIYLPQVLDQDNLLRLTYLAKSMSSSWVLTSFLDYAAFEHSKTTYKSRARATQVLIRLFSYKELRGCLHKFPVEDLQVFLQHCLYMSDLEALKIPYDFMTLLNCDKLALCKSLYKNHYKEKRTLQLVAAIMMDYCLEDSKLWKNIVEGLKECSSYLVLLHLLEWLCSSGIYNSIFTLSLHKLLSSTTLELLRISCEKIDKYKDADKAIERIIEISLELELRKQSLEEMVKLLVEFRKGNWVKGVLKLGLVLGDTAVAQLLALSFKDKSIIKEVKKHGGCICKYLDLSSKRSILKTMVANPDMFHKFINFLPKDCYSAFESDLEKYGIQLDLNWITTN